MQRFLTSRRSKSILASYVVVSIAILLIPVYYSWQTCEINRQYLGENIGYCSSGITGAFGTIFFNPLAYLLVVPTIVGIILTALHVFHWKISASTVRISVFSIAFLTAVSSSAIILYSLFVYGEDDFYREKQCTIGQPPEEPYCLYGTAIANFTSIIAPTQIAFCLAWIVLVVLYRNLDVDSQRREMHLPPDS